MDKIYSYVEGGFREALKTRNLNERRLGAELKFPLVHPDGSAVPLDMVRGLWKYLVSIGWEPVTDSMTGEVTGAKKPGPQNHTVASCETGYCKTEFSLAHVANLTDLQAAIDELVCELRGFSKENNVCFLAHGILPGTRPSRDLLMKQSRTSVWDHIFGTNKAIPPEDGCDLHLFTVNAASHVHISVDMDEAVSIVNILNGFAPAQTALTAHSGIWKGAKDPKYKCAAEKFWDWASPEPGRTGIPEKPFEDLRDYIETVFAFKPVYAKRDGQPLLLDSYASFADYYAQEQAEATDMNGNKVPVTPRESDIDTHSTCYWYNARISRYYTVENRVNDQQPAEDLAVIGAITLGLVAARDKAEAELNAYRWQDIIAAREQACRHGLDGRVDGFTLQDFARTMVTIAEEGLSKRGMGEEAFLKPLRERLETGKCPADTAAEIFDSQGMEGLVAQRKL